MVTLLISYYQSYVSFNHVSADKHLKNVYILNIHIKLVNVAKVNVFNK